MGFLSSLLLARPFLGIQPNWKRNSGTAVQVLPYGNIISMTSPTFVLNWSVSRASYCIQILRDKNRMICFFNIISGPLKENEERKKKRLIYDCERWATQEVSVRCGACCWAGAAGVICAQTCPLHPWNRNRRGGKNGMWNNKTKCSEHKNWKAFFFIFRWGRINRPPTMR